MTNQLRKRVYGSPVYPKSVPKYAQYLRANIPPNIKLVSSSFPVDDIGRIAVELEIVDELTFTPVPRKPSMRNIEAYSEWAIAKGMNEALYELWTDEKVYADVGDWAAYWWLTKAVDMCDMLGIGGGRLQDSIACEFVGVRNKRTRKYLQVYSRFKWEFVYYGAYADAGRGGARNAGYKTATGTSEFYEALREWVERKLAPGDEADVQRVTRAIYQNINRGGTVTQPTYWFVGTLYKMFAEDKWDYYWNEAMGHRMEQAVSNGIEKGLKYF